jgi:hypothetical protein
LFRLSGSATRLTATRIFTEIPPGKSANRPAEKGVANQRERYERERAR